MFCSSKKGALVWEGGYVESAMAPYISSTTRKRQEAPSRSTLIRGTYLLLRVGGEHVFHGVVLPNLGQLSRVLELLRQELRQEVKGVDDDVEQQHGRVYNLRLLAHRVEQLRKQKRWQGKRGCSRRRWTQGTVKAHQHLFF